MDSIIITENPPLFAMWTPIGTQACIPITGAHARRVLTGVLNIKSGDGLFYGSHTFDQDTCQNMFRAIRAHWRGWHIVLFLDRHSAHRAARTRQLARELGIQLRWLPTACPKLNPVDHLWRHVTRDILANEPLPDVDATVRQVWAYVSDLSPRERLHKAGILSENFWLADLIT